MDLSHISTHFNSPTSCHPFSSGFSFDERVRFQDPGFQPCDSIHSIHPPQALPQSDSLQRHQKRHSGFTATTSGSEESGDHFFESQSQDDNVPNDHQNQNTNTKLTSEKRKAQNRAAQRNFRERKDRQSKENEETLVIRTEENKQMCVLIESLQAENDFLRQNIPALILAQLSISLPTVARPVLTLLGLPPRPTTTGIRRDGSQAQRLKNVSLR
ncbi:uncharacterized protein MELLADRAFT_112159 [Melampsora larici-populina 98AG31]|uniref:BZIP domain-containing protein n=1 Tax=Melampsora larici-populina (strain 98AG31 / pathotype 3-4-7) TaxID=747676 RepID=F4S5K4_MELLP|nr:uncharacterized protein MELLADRAFT_112159 [Melampsora larici-populina 98AG31]EGG00092.1 hypothetical protein MELLADRAFT_112159 [Melampsora larici-populina 98AG31]